MTDLQFFTNGPEVVIARNTKDAIVIWEETTGENWADYEDEFTNEFTKWELYTENPVKLAWIDDEPKQTDVPKGGYTEKAGSDYISVVATQKQWINHCGRCYFSTSEW